MSLAMNPHSPAAHIVRRTLKSHIGATAVTALRLVAPNVVRANCWKYTGQPKSDFLGGHHVIFTDATLTHVSEVRKLERELKPKADSFKFTRYERA